MEQSHLQDRISWGLNRTARHIGQKTDAYRPKGNGNPLSPTNRFLQLQAAFSASDGKFSRPNGYGNALWQGYFDSAYTQPGDYLVQDGNIWFIAAQQKLLPVLCVQTNRTASFVRPAATSTIGLNPYGGMALQASTKLITDIPVSILGISSAGKPSAALPDDSVTGWWTVLLPAIAPSPASPIILRPADLIKDDLGRIAIITGSELTDLGWRLSVRQATT